MKKLLPFLLLLGLMACGSESSTADSSAEADTPTETTAPEPEPEPEPEASPYVGSWKVMEVDGQEVQLSQVFTFNEDGTMSQSLMDNVISTGTWESIDEGIKGIGEGGGEDIFAVESVDATTLIFTWEGKRSVLTKQ